MGTFHTGLGALHGMTVVLDMDDARLIVGRLHEMDDDRVILHDADVHDEGATGISRREYLRRAAVVGVWSKHPTLTVPRVNVLSVTRLGEIEV
ncbi:MAG: hypothetical protein ACYS99_07515 [Planctomycetota bacterium]|jgi:hypothetical protein